MLYRLKSKMLFFIIFCIIILQSVNTLTVIDCQKNMEHVGCDEVVTCYDYYMRGGAKSAFYKLKLRGSDCKPLYLIVWCDKEHRKTVIQHSLSDNNDFVQLKGKGVLHDKSYSIRLHYSMDLNTLKLLMDSSESCSQKIIIDGNLPYSIGQKSQDIITRSVYQYNDTLIQRSAEDLEVLSSLPGKTVVSLKHEASGIYAFGVNKTMHQADGHVSINVGYVMCSGKRSSSNGCHLGFHTLNSWLSHELSINAAFLNMSMYFRTRKFDVNLLVALDTAHKQSLSVFISAGRILEINNQISNFQIFLGSNKTDYEWHYFSVEQQQSGNLKIRLDFEIFIIENFVKSVSWDKININGFSNCSEKNFEGCIYNLTVNENLICQTKSHSLVYSSCFTPPKNDYSSKEFETSQKELQEQFTRDANSGLLGRKRRDTDKIENYTTYLNDLQPLPTKAFCEPTSFFHLDEPSETDGKLEIEMPKTVDVEVFPPDNFEFTSVCEDSANFVYTILIFAIPALFSLLLILVIITAVVHCYRKKRQLAVKYPPLKFEGIMPSFYGFESTSGKINDGYNCGNEQE